MIVQVETVSFTSEPSDYIENYPIHEEEKTYSHDNSDYEFTRDISYVEVDRLDAIIDEIGINCIVQDPDGDSRRHDDAEWVVRIYDGYNE